MNPCSRTSPCRTFAAAIAATAINGEINCLDPGGFDAVTITKSITIDCEDTQGSILVSAGAAILINIGTTATADPTATVRLRGLSINGSAGTLSAHGIHVSNSNIRQVRLFVDEVFIQNFVNTGIFFNAPGGRLVVRNSLITNITSGPAILARSGLAGQTGIIHTAITRTTTNLSQQGVRFEGNSFGVVSDSTASITLSTASSSSRRASAAPR